VRWSRSTHVEIAVPAAMVEDVSQQIALRILGDRLAEMEAHTPEDRADILVRVVRHV